MIFFKRKSQWDEESKSTSEILQTKSKNIEWKTAIKRSERRVANEYFIPTAICYWLLVKDGEEHLICCFWVFLRDDLDLWDYVQEPYVNSVF